MSGDHNQYQKPDKAFPHHLREDYKGMDLRDYFAAGALPLAMRWVKHNYEKQIGNAWMWNEEEYEDDSKAIAKVAYQIADAMMKVREERE